MKLLLIKQNQLVILAVLLFIGTYFLMSNHSKNSQKYDIKTNAYENNKIKSLDLQNLIFKFDKLNGMDSYLKNSADKQEKDTLIATLNFMLDDRDAEDEELVKFVKNLIHTPFADNERNLSDKTRKDFSQIGQSKYIDGLLGSQRDGFFVEAGGYDGEAHSNSLFFELNRNWNGILIEPSKMNFNKLIGKKRRIFALNACITDKVLVGKFRAFDESVLSGLEETMSEHHKKRGKTGKYTFVPCFSLVTILKAIDIKKVDYFSLDVEGLAVLFV